MDQSGSGGSGFDLSKMTMVSKIIGIGGLAYLIDLFLPWQRACATAFSLSVCGSASGFHGIGFLNFIVVAILIVMEVLLLANVNVDVGTPAMRMQMDSYLCFALLVLTGIKIAVDNESIYVFAFVGLVLSIVIAYGGYLRLQESKEAPPAPPAPSGGGDMPS